MFSIIFQTKQTIEQKLKLIAENQAEANEGLRNACKKLCHNTNLQKEVDELKRDLENLEKSMDHPKMAVDNGCSISAPAITHRD